ncbi:MAG: T9SS type A sorting domain-containing protein, partial [candidate division KSB1 bacterium]
PEEGLYFSSDGGQNFLPVATFGIDNETEDIYLDPPPIDVDALAAAKGLALTSTFVIRFQQIGTRDFNGSAGADGFIIDDVSVTVPQIEYARLPFTDGFEDGVFRPMWYESNASEPAVGQVTAPVFAPSRRSGRVEVVNSNPNARTGTFSAFIGRWTDGELTTNALDLRLNLAGHTQVELRYWLRDFFDQIQQGEGLYFSDNGGQSFVQVAPFDIENETEDVYLDPPPIDVDALAKANGLSLTSTFVIRFQQIGSRDFNGSAGANGFIIDDVSVTVPQIEYVLLPFDEGFETGVFRPMWHEGNPSEPAVGEVTAPVFAPSRRGGRVEVVNFAANARTGMHSVHMGRSFDGQSTTNALDLRLNLSGNTQVELRFWLKDFFDETQQQEGLYFSDDSGKNFVQVLGFDPSSRPDNQYTQQPVDVDALAATNGLTLSSAFVIRFQQIGASDFNGDGGADGFIIDDISIIGNSTSVSEQNDAVPETFTVFQNHPNPFNPSTQISFALPSAQRVTLKVFDLTGKEVATLLRNEHRAAGVHVLTFEAQHLPSGVYLYRLHAGELVETKKMLLVR